MEGQEMVRERVDGCGRRSIISVYYITLILVTDHDSNRISGSRGLLYYCKGLIGYLQAPVKRHGLITTVILLWLLQAYGQPLHAKSVTLCEQQRLLPDHTCGTVEHQPSVGHIIANAPPGLMRSQNSLR